MNHQVLARKWRPHSFEEMIGQTPVIRALSNALSQGRLHHAYLFTGTRGVGKTTIARILAKCLNCEKAVSAKPCGQCFACQQIDQGRFFDLIEVDAASRTKVEDTRELLENVQYAPTQGRYKIYLIDEVHMLSGHSFNALLKTLEEPPEHVKFLLATTDPQRLPITVLSRCLQFHMKNLPNEQIASQLSHILQQENLSFEAPALNILAHAARGSMRDALSLLDQAIAYGDGLVKTTDVQNMLGMTQPQLIIQLLQSLGRNEGNQLFASIDELANTGADFQRVLEEVLTLLHQLAVYKAVPQAPTDGHFEESALKELHGIFEAETIQLYYQIGLIGRRDISLAPTTRSGFEMLMLRMLTFKPGNKPEKTSTPPPPVATPMPSKATVATASATKTSSPAQLAPNSDWQSILSALNLKGPLFSLASHCILQEMTADRIHLILDHLHAPLLNKAMEERLTQALQTHYGKAISLAITVGQPAIDTPATVQKKRTEARQTEAVQSIMNDGNVQAIISMFDAKVINDSVKAIAED
jgi:DNA polymerase-3 subunit gamma/tau